MSWSVQLIGKPDKISEALTAQSDKLSGQSKQEYDEALPHLKALVETNTDNLLRLTANGHASFSDGKKVSGYLSANLEPMYGALV